VRVLEHPLATVSRVARPYPGNLLEPCKTGLCLFSAAFLGHNDAIHFARHGLLTTCVDIDGAKLQEMERLYPDDWSFIRSDAWEFAEWCSGRSEWDAVSVDTFTGDPMFHALATLELWCSIATRLVTVTITRDASAEPPDGWKASRFPRSSAVDWLVLQRA
jgi:hypothetical protein